MALYIETEDGLKPQSFKGHAAGTYYDNTESGLDADNAQDAIDEINSIKASKENLSNYILTGTKPSTALTSGTFFVDKDGALRVATTDIATTDDVGSGNSAVKSVGEILTELNSNLTATPIMTIDNTNNQYISTGYIKLYKMSNVIIGFVFAALVDTIELPLNYMVLENIPLQYQSSYEQNSSLVSGGDLSGGCLAIRSGQIQLFYLESRILRGTFHYILE